jgi:hypothetical protein
MMETAVSRASPPSRRRRAAVVLALILLEVTLSLPTTPSSGSGSGGGAGGGGAGGRLPAHALEHPALLLVNRLLLALLLPERLLLSLTHRLLLVARLGSNAQPPPTHDDIHTRSAETGRERERESERGLCVVVARGRTGARWCLLAGAAAALPAWEPLRTSARAAILICAAAALASFFTLILSSLDSSSTLCRGCLISAIVLPSSSAFCAPRQTQRRRPTPLT